MRQQKEASQINTFMSTLSYFASAFTLLRQYSLPTGISLGTGLNVTPRVIYHTLQPPPNPAKGTE